LAARGGGRAAPSSGGLNPPSSVLRRSFESDVRCSSKRCAERWAEEAEGVEIGGGRARQPCIFGIGCSLRSAASK
jgi:hypothetical protein